MIIVFLPLSLSAPLQKHNVGFVTVADSLYYCKTMGEKTRGRRENWRRGGSLYLQNYTMENNNNNNSQCHDAGDKS